MGIPTQDKTILAEQERYGESVDQLAQAWRRATAGVDALTARLVAIADLAEATTAAAQKAPAQSSKS